MGWTSLSAFIRAREEEILRRWTEAVVGRLSLPSDREPELVDDMPEFVRELATCLEKRPDEWSPSGAAAHGRHRHGMGLDPGELVQEFELLVETVLGLARDEGLSVPLDQTILLVGLVTRGVRASVEEYVELRDRQAEERAASEFSFVAHELRTPLHTARLALELLSPHIADDPPYLLQLRRALDQIALLIDDRITESRLKGEVRPHYELVDLAALVRQACDDLRTTAQRRSIELVLETAPCELRADRKLLSSIVVNLVNNAIKFSRERCAVTVRVRRSGERAELRVADACGGMPDEKLAGLFQPFVQLGKDRSGFGLGLTIVKQAVEAHAGDIRVENEPGKGCEFVVELPRDADG